MGKCLKMPLPGVAKVGPLGLGSLFF